jgi:hypothetical protein
MSFNFILLSAADYSLDEPRKAAIFPRIRFRKLQASFLKPETSEGFTEVVDVDFEVSDRVPLTLLSGLKIWISGLGVTSSLRSGEDIGFKTTRSRVEEQMVKQRKTNSFPHHERHSL